MRHRLPSLRQKIERSSAHLAALNREWQAFLDTEPHTFVVEKHGKEPWYTAYLGECEQPPSILSVYAGEVVYHLRSLLEHAVWALVEGAGETPGKHNTFPVRVKPYAGEPFEVVAGRDSLKGVPAAAVALIEQAQPYHAGDGAAHHWLALLDWLAKVDRHHALFAASAAMDPAEGVRDLFHADPGYEIREFHPLFERGLFLQPGTQIARFRVEPDSGLEDKVDMHGQFPALVAFGEGPARMVPTLTLEYLRDRVVGLIDALVET